MATLSTVAVRDNSTLTNFKQWSQVISNFMATAGWIQTTDTGQVNWGTIASVPTAGNYVYEIWKPGDALATFFFKIEYGTRGGTTTPGIRLSLGTSTNGAGTLSGLIVGPFISPNANYSVNSTVTQFNCYLSGATGRMGVAMWVNDSAVGGNPGGLFFVVARSKNSSGSNTSVHVTLVTGGGSTNAGTIGGMQTIVFGTGVTNALTSGSNSQRMPVIATNLPNNLFASTDVPVSPFFPFIGPIDNPLIEIGCAATGDITDQATFSIAAANTPYGTSHTFIGFNAATGGVVSWTESHDGGNTGLVLLFE